MLAQAASAQQEPPIVSGQPDEIDRLPGELDSFVQDAINEGLLRPAKPQPAETPASPVADQPAENVSPQDIRPQVTETAEEQAPAEPAATAQIQVEYLCPETSPYDFAEFSDFTSYGDLAQWRGFLEGEERTTALGRLMAKAYLSLGMIAEARSEIKGDYGQGGVALRLLTDLLDRDTRPDLSFFRDVASCAHADGVWLAIGQLKSNDANGADLLAQHFADFRALPLRLRADAAFIVIPALDRLDRPILSERLMTSFTAEEFAQSRELQFVKALQRLSMGSPSAADDIRGYLRRAQYRNEAASALRRHGKAISSELEREIVDYYINELGNLPAEASVSENLDLILHDLNSAVGYDLTLRLADVPAAADPESRERLAGHFEDMLDEDLQSDAFLINLKAMDALMKGEALLADRAGTEARFARAAAIAANLGLPSMSAKLSERLTHDAALALAQAELAFRLKDDATLARLLEENPDSVAIRKVALIDAINRGDRAAFNRLVRGIPEDVDTALMLIEADAAAGHWVVPQRFYTIAARSGDEETQIRALRVSDARPAPEPPTGGEIELTDVSSRLERLRESLGPIPTEVR
ncbi:hypothetical protein D1224_05455 [Henriciella barbarensis]|uniref:Uncharacterized protein n=2 Tax=Henriciella barbarensis TaxID=86342 RepID=A0A399QXQ9_9PROT|nr:hypothetical protein D1224_05455 [Henriciella barbarensis]